MHPTLQEVHRRVVNRPRGGSGCWGVIISDGLHNHIITPYHIAYVIRMYVHIVAREQQRSTPVDSFIVLGTLSIVIVMFIASVMQDRYRVQLACS